MAFPEDRLRVAVEAQVDGSWVDVRASREVLAASGISVQRGRQNESPRPAQSEARLAIKSPTGKWSPRNPRSEYFRKIGRNTPLRIALDRTIDTFEGRTEVDSWGTSSDGNAAWSVSSPATSYDVAAGVGTMVTVNQGDHTAATVGTYGDCEILAKLRTTALDSNLEFGITARWNSVDNFVAVVYDELDGELEIRKIVDNTTQSSGLVDAAITITPNTWYWWRVVVLGDYMRIRVWEDGTDAPTTWIEWFDGDVLRVGKPPRTGRVGVIARNLTAVPTAVVGCDYFKVDDWRFHGEIPSWPPRWTGGGRDAHVPVIASGILRRLDGNGAKRLKSAMYRAVTHPDNASAIVAYNPGEDGSGATQVASGIDGGPAMTVVGTEVRFSTGSGFAGSEPLITMAADTSFNARIPTGPDTGEFRFRMLFKFPTAGSIADTIPICEVGMSDPDTRKYMLVYRSTGDLHLLAFDQQWNQVGSSGSQNFNLDGLRAMVGFQVVQNGADVDWQIATHKILDDNTEVGQTASGTFAGINVGPPLWYAIAPSGGLTDAEVGHFVVVNDVTALNNLAPGALTGWAGESGADRFIRLCEEEGIDGALLGDAGDTPPMGAQLIDTLASNLIAVEALDGGQLFEPRQWFGLAYRPGHTLVSQTPVATLSYASSEIFEPAPQPEDDDLLIRNDVTVERVGGSSERATLLDGPMSVRPPDDPTDPGIGTYEDPHRVIAYDDGQLRDIAYWRLNTGTYDGYRWPTLTTKQVGLLRKGKATLAAAVRTLDVADLYALADLPEWLPPDDEHVLALGMQEYMDDHQHDITWAGIPGAPYRVTTRTDFFGTPGDVVDSARSIVAAPFEVGDTVLPVAVDVPPLWATGVVDFDVMVQGVRLHVTNISAAAAFSDTGAGATANGWGTPTSSIPGTGYTVVGTASEYARTGGVLRQTLVSTNSAHHAYAAAGIEHGEYRGQVTIPVVPTGASIEGKLTFRGSGSGDYYEATVSVATTAVVTVVLGGRVDGTGFSIDSTTAPSNHSAGNTWNIATRFFGTQLAAKAWRTVDTEPDWQVSGEDDQITSGDEVGCWSRRNTGNTNGSQNIDFDNLSIANPQLFTVDAAAVNGIDPPGGIAAGEEVHVYPRTVRTLAGGLFSTPYFVSGADTPGTGTAENPAIGTGGLTSTTYVPTATGSPLIGTSFVASSSGTAVLHFMGQVSNSGASQTLVSFSLKTGAVLDQGEEILAPDDSRAVMQLGTDARRLGMSLLLTGLEERQQYNVVLKQRVTAGTGTISRRMIIVKPDGAHGALPGAAVPREPNSASDRQDASDTSTSTAYTTADMTPCGTAFEAPPSGRVYVHLSSLIDNGAANTMFVSFEVRAGDTVGAGTVFQAASDNTSISWLNTNEAHFGRSFLVTGLTAGSDYNVQLMHRVTAGTGTLQYRYVVVEPTS